MSGHITEAGCLVQVLCDRLGIFVDGQLVCIGNPKELTARYGGYVVSPPPPHQPVLSGLSAIAPCGLV